MGPFGTSLVPTFEGLLVGGVAVEEEPLGERAEPYATLGVGGASVQSEPLVEYVGDKVVVHASKMVPGTPYPLKYRGRTAVGIRNEDGTFSLYEVPRRR